MNKIKKPFNLLGASMFRNHRLLALFITTVFTSLVALSACGDGNSGSARVKNAALSSSTPVPYSCAQLETEEVSEETTSVAFSLCDEAVRYSIVTPDGVMGSIADTDVQGNEVIRVPVSKSIDGDYTIFTVQVDGAEPLDPYHPGVHVYQVALSRATTTLVEENDPSYGKVFTKILYEMPAPKTFDAFSSGTSVIGVEQYLTNLEEYLQKWAMVRLPTCTSSLSLAVISQTPIKSVLGYAQIDAKRRLKRNLYTKLSQARYFTSSISSLPAGCLNGLNSYNIFTNGIHKGFVPLNESEILESDNVEALLQTTAYGMYAAQVKSGQCPVDDNVSSELSRDDFETVSTNAYKRISELVIDNPVAIAAEYQLTLLMMMTEIRNEYGVKDLCTKLPSGYYNEKELPKEKALEFAANTLPEKAISDITVQDAVTPDSTPSLGESALLALSNSPAPLGAETWNAPIPSPSLTVGGTMSKSRVVAASNIVIAPKSKVVLTRLATSKRFCSMTPKSVKALRVGTCKMTVVVSAKGKKTIRTTVSIKIKKK